MKFQKNEIRLYQTKQRLKAIGSNLLRYVFLIAFSYVLVYPILFLFSKAFQAPIDSVDPTVQWIPKHYTTAHLINAVALIRFWKSCLNTVVYMLVAAGLEIVACLFYAYGYARYNFRGKKILTVMLLLLIMVPNTMTIIPNYVNLSHFDFLGIFGLLAKWTGVDIRPSLIGSALSFYLPALLGVGIRSGIFIFIYSQFFKGLPKELEEAASIDGAGFVRTLFRIVVPSSGVAVLTVSILAVIWHWNEYYLPKFYLAESQFPVSVNLERIENLAISFTSSPAATPYNYQLVVTAACLLSVIPMLVFYLIFQRRFISSIATSGIVG